MKLRFALLLSLTVYLAVAASSASARSVSPSIKLSSVSGSAAAAVAQPALGTSVTFATVVPTNVKNPRVEVLCYQAGALVYGEAGAPRGAVLLGGGGSLLLFSGGGAAARRADHSYFLQGAR